MRQLNFEAIHIEKETFHNYDVITCQAPILNASPHNQREEENRLLDHILPRRSTAETAISHDTLERQQFTF